MSLTTPYDDQNIFAKILRGDMPCARVFEDEKTFVFMDAFPQSRGHVLIVPKTPSVNFLGVDAGDIAPLFYTVQRVATAVNKALDPDGIVMTQFNGAPAGQTVFHTHVHIIPRYQDADLGRHGSGGMADMDELKELAAKIRAEMKEK